MGAEVVQQIDRAQALRRTQTNAEIAKNLDGVRETILAAVEHRLTL